MGSARGGKTIVTGSPDIRCYRPHVLLIEDKTPTVFQLQHFF